MMLCLVQSNRSIYWFPRAVSSTVSYHHPGSQSMVWLLNRHEITFEVTNEPYVPIIGISELWCSIAVYCWFSLHQWLERRPDPRSQRWIGSWTGIIPMTPPASWPWLFLDVCWEDAVSENLRKFKFRSGNPRIIRKLTKVRVNSRRHHPFGNGL